MKLIISYILVAIAAFVSADPYNKPALVKGIDVASYQCNISWPDQKKAGIEFAYIKATEGTSKPFVSGSLCITAKLIRQAYKNPCYTKQYTGAYNASIMHGAYHFARPDRASGAKQAEFFIKNGGNWSADGKTLPGALDVEYGPKGKTCWGLSAPKMVAWIKDFSDYYHNKTGRYPVIYTGTNWWKKCTRNSVAFGSNPLWIPHYGPS
ncbi:lysozyme [Ceratobasidium sp. AG-Ba]|nr:lysozyme [Ceratobasidium sp. AG-Ba]QRV98753.1 lysozyme [Ceratobasidium sp. AG-Ba]